MLPNVFVGSCAESLELAQTVKRGLDGVARVTVWNEGVFCLSKSYLESLVDSLPDLDFAVLVASPVDRAWARDEEHPVPRDNILFEMGLFMGSLGRLRTFILEPEECPLKLPSDLDGIKTATYRMGALPGQAQGVEQGIAEIRRAIADQGPRPRVESRLAQIQEQQTDQGREIEATMGFLIENLLTDWERQHLRSLGAPGRVPYEPRKCFERELRRMLELGLILRLPGKGVGTAMKDPSPDRDLKQHLQVSPKGEKYLARLARIRED